MNKYLDPQESGENTTVSTTNTIFLVDVTFISR